MLLTQAQLVYQISPILLTGGIASQTIDGMLPLLTLTDPGILTSGDDFQLEDAFAIFSPVVGGSLVQETIAKYPFANLSVAANAIIREPIEISMVMMTPMKNPQAWENKLSIMTALKATLDQHNNAGGTYTVFTPAFTYTDMLMKDLVDVSMATSPIPQNAWRWDFEKPLVTLADVTGSLSNLMQLITAGLATDGATTSPATAIGTSPSSGNAITPSSVPPTQNYDPLSSVSAPASTQISGTS